MSKESLRWLVGVVEAQGDKPELANAMRALFSEPDELEGALALTNVGVAALTQLLAFIDEAPPTANLDPVEFAIGYKPLLDVLPKDDATDVEAWNDLHGQTVRLRRRVSQAGQDVQRMNSLQSDWRTIIERVSDFIYIRVVGP